MYNTHAKKAIGKRFEQSALSLHLEIFYCESPLSEAT